MAKVTRRDFLKVISAGTCGSLIHQTIGPANRFMAYAMPPVVGAVGTAPILVVLNFAGGIDLHAMSPHYGGWWMDLNPTLAFTPQTSIPLNSEQGIHPSLPYLKTLWDEGTFAILNLVGNGQYTRAHDLETATKLSGYTGGDSAYGGWPGRLTAQMGSALGGVSLSNEALVVESTGNNPVRAVGDLNNFGEDSLFYGDANTWFRSTRENLIFGSNAPGNAKHASVQAAILNVDSMTKTLQQQTNITLPVQFPGTGLGRGFQDIARIANAGLGTQFFFLEQGGHDTHSGARQSEINSMNEVNGAIQAFVNCAKVQGWWNRVIILSLSEFGRTYENGNQGDDHGNANAAWIMGGGVRGGRIIGPAATAADLAGRTYFHNYHIDFRQIFKEVIAGMGFNSNLVFPEPVSYTPLGFF